MQYALLQSIYWISESGNHLKLTVTQTNKSTSCRAASEKLMTCRAAEPVLYRACLFLVMSRIMPQKHMSFKVEAELELVLVPHCRKSIITFWHRRWHLTSGDSSDRRRRKTSLSIHVLFMSLIVTCIITVAQESIQVSKAHTHTCIHTRHLVIFYAFILIYLLSLYFCHNLYVYVLFSVC